MTSDDDSVPPEKAEDRRGRPPRPPLTIDLAANPPEASAAKAEPPAAEEAAASAAATSESDAPAGPAAGTAEAAPAGATAETSAAAASAPRAAPPRARRSAVILGSALAGLIGAAILVAAVFGLIQSGIVEPPGESTGQAAAAKANAIGASLATLETRLAAIESRGAANAAGIDDLAKRVSGLESAEKSLEDRLGKAETTLAARPEGKIANMDQVLDDLMARVEKVEAAVGSAAAGTPSAGLSDLEGRVSNLETSSAAMAQRLAALQAHPSAGGDTEKAARALAIGSLRQAAAAGGPFADNLAMLQALGLDETDIAALRPLAEKGAPPKSELAGSFPEVADRILAASAAVDPNAGFFDRLAGFARGLVTVRPTTPIAGDTPDAIVSRMQGAVDRGDLAKALAERNALPADGKAVSAAWAQGASDRLAIDRLVEKLSRAAGALPAAQD
jgi:hypothetical protein